MHMHSRAVSSHGGQWRQGWEQTTRRLPFPFHTPHHHQPPKRDPPSIPKTRSPMELALSSRFIPSASLANAPEDIIAQILKYLSVLDVLAVRQVSKLFPSRRIHYSTHSASTICSVPGGCSMCHTREFCGSNTHTKCTPAASSPSRISRRDPRASRPLYWRTGQRDRSGSFMRCPTCMRRRSATRPSC